MLGGTLGKTSHHSSKQVSAVCQSTALHFTSSIKRMLAGDWSLLLLLSTPIRFHQNILLTVLWLSLGRGNIFFSTQDSVILQDLTGKLLTKTNMLLVRNFAAKCSDKARETKHGHVCSAPHQRENTPVVGHANASLCVLGPGSRGSEQQRLVLASKGQ